jgi:hypothetical protein
VNEAERWREMSLNLVEEVGYLRHTPQGSLTCRKILRHETDGFSSPPKEVVLHIFIALKSPSSSAGSEPAKIESSGKHDNH